jgi:ABC-type polysaccharide/polyol phosphate transport system ATPase subunit
MSTAAVSVENVWKCFRMYHDKNQYLKTTLLRGRRARYEEFWALQDVSFEIQTGSTFGIIGSNGSGKSTLLKCLAGILTPDKGRLSSNGQVVALLELGAGFHSELSGRENIYLNGAILGMSRSEINNRIDEIVAFSELEQFIDTPVKNYSSGMTVRLGFAIATSVEPEILIIDEVLAVGDAAFQQRCFEKIESFRRDGRTIIFVSHGLSQVVQLCDEVAWLEKGALKALGPSLDIVSDYTGTSFNASPRLEGEVGDRWGTGDAEIKKIELINESNEVCDVFSTGEPLAIQISYSSRALIKDLVVGVRITDLHGHPVWGTNTRRRGVTISDVVGSGMITYSLQELPLLEGTYELTVALSDSSEIEVFDHWERRIRFNVNQHKNFDEGLVHFKGTWTESALR